MAQSKRGVVMTTLAAAFGLLALSDLLKPLHLEGAETGFVFLGTRLSGAANAIVGPLFGLFLLLYAAAIWRMRRYALPIAYGYAAYVIVNLALFSVKNPAPASAGEWAFVMVYIVVAIGVSSGAALILRRRRAELG